MMNVLCKYISGLIKNNYSTYWHSGFMYCHCCFVSKVVIKSEFPIERRRMFCNGKTNFETPEYYSQGECFGSCI